MPTGLAAVGRAFFKAAGNAQCLMSNYDPYTLAMPILSQCLMSNYDPYTLQMFWRVRLVIP